MKKILIYSFILFISFLAAPTSSLANSFSLQMTPQQYEVVVQPGKTITIPYRIANIGDPQTIRIGIYSLSIKDNEGNYTVHPYISNENNITFKIAGNTVALDSPFLFKTNNSLDFDLEISIPENIPEKDYTFSVIAENEVQKGFGTSAIALQGGIGSNILLTVSKDGSTDQQGKIIQYELLSAKTISFNDKKYAFYNSNSLIPIMLIAANSGQNGTKASGSITLTSINRDLKSDQPSYTIHPQYIFPDSQRILKTATDSVCEKNDLELCKEPHSLIIKSPFMGIYKLAAVVAFGENSQIGYGNITFIVFPFWYTLICFGLLSIFISTLLVIRKKIK